MANYVCMYAWLMLILRITVVCDTHATYEKVSYQLFKSPFREYRIQSLSLVVRGKTN